MLRAVYRWKVKPEHEDVFVEAWIRGTETIQNTMKGARDSVLLQSRRNPSEFMAVACWDSVEDWLAFQCGAPLDAEAFRVARAVSRLQSTELFHTARDLKPALTPEGGMWAQFSPRAISDGLRALRGHSDCGLVRTSTRPEEKGRGRRPSLSIHEQHILPERPPGQVVTARVGRKERQR